jgi:hypothetical protein
MRIWSRLRSLRKNSEEGSIRSQEPPPTIADWVSAVPQLKGWTENICHPDFDPVNSKSSRPIGPNLMEFDTLLHPEFLSLLTREVSDFIDWQNQTDARIEPPNSMHYGGFTLDQLGLGPTMDAIAREILSPLASHLFPERGFKALTEAHAFVVEYGGYGDQNLDFHVDDSELTLTLCLGEKFTGSDIYFSGIRCPEHRQEPESQGDRIIYSPCQGRGLVHLGSHRHGVLPIESGHRISLIVWAKDPEQNEDRAFGDGRCPDWCESPSSP